MNILYRISDNGYKKAKLPNATKLHCLSNARLKFFSHTFHVFVDQTNLTVQTKSDIESVNCDVRHEYVAGSSAGSFRVVFDFALTLPDDELVYFLEDDYLHLDGSPSILLEGLERADYVSLYDHADKYIPSNMGGNKFIEDDGGELTKVFITKSSHWKLTNSTTMTFAAKVSTLRQDKPIWDQFIQGTHPNDFQAFLALRDVGRTLLTPIPGRSTHCEPMWLSPLIDWSVI